MFFEVVVLRSALDHRPLTEAGLFAVSVSGHLHLEFVKLKPSLHLCNMQLAAKPPQRYYNITALLKSWQMGRLHPHYQVSVSTLHWSSRVDKTEISKGFAGSVKF